MAARLAHARRIGARYAAEPGVLGVWCAGSVGRGHADRWSDLEVPVLWATPPSDAARAVVVSNVGGLDTWPQVYDETERMVLDVWWMDGSECAGLQVEVPHLTVDDAEALLHRLLIELDPDPYLLGFAAALAYGQVLHGCEELTSLMDRVASYPRALAAAVAREHGRVNHFWRWRMYVERGNPHGLAAHFADVAGRVEHMLCALNRRWWPGVKWPGWTMADLAIAPPDVAVRLRAAAGASPAEAAAGLTGIVEETYDLLDEHLPEANPARLREIFRLDRGAWPPTTP